jgi:hypothetical protein
MLVQGMPRLGWDPRLYKAATSGVNYMPCTYSLWPCVTLCHHLYLGRDSLLFIRNVTSRIRHLFFPSLYLGSFVLSNPQPLL